MKENCKNEMVFSGAADLFDIMKMFLKREHNVTGAAEHLWVVSLSSAGKLANIELVPMRGRSFADIRTADIFQVALQKGAESVMVVYNREDYTVEPGKVEKTFTGRMIQAGEIIDLAVIDYMIISTEKYYSFKESGLMEQLRTSEQYHPGEAEKKRLEKESLEIQAGADSAKEREVAELSRSEAIAEQMLNNGEPIDKIIKYTGLSPEHISKITSNSEN